jgi:steroid 5-alpha reductase family enzyme
MHTKSITSNPTPVIDYRYKAMRRSMGPKFRWVSLFSVFGLQAVRNNFRLKLQLP